MAAGTWLGRELTRPRYDLRGKVVLLTGGSRGLGLELARVLAGRRARLALVARDEEELARARDDLRARGAEVETFGCDIRFQDQVQRTVREVVERFGRVDVLVNNAGVIQVGPHETMRVSDYQEAMDTHFFGPLYLVQTVLPEMRRRREGRIVNISSVGGKVPTPHLLPYVASKFALVGWSEGLHAELRKDGIVVTTVCPGLMRTGSPRHVAVKGDHQVEYAWFKVLDSLPYFSMSSRAAARAIVRGIELGRAELILTGRARTGARLQGLAPGLLSELLAVGARLLPRALATGLRALVRRRVGVGRHPLLRHRAHPTGGGREQRAAAALALISPPGRSPPSHPRARPGRSPRSRRTGER